MTEACQRVTDFWFNALHQEVLRALKPATTRVAENLGEQRHALIRVEKQPFTAGMLDAEL